MILVQRNRFFHGSAFCLFLIYTMSNASLNSTNTITSHSRVKRDHGSCVTGMSLNSAMSSGDANTLNAEANSGGGRGRGKRSIDSTVSKVDTGTSVRNKRSPPPPHPSHPPPFRKLLTSVLKSMPKINKRHRRGWFATRTQEIFSRINHNPSFAQSFKNSESVQDSEFLSSRIVVNARGVTCNQLCSYPGSRYGLVGFCTPDYCQCFVEHDHWDHNSWGIPTGHGHGWDGIGQEKERSCNKKKVFDPVRLKCADPTKIELCSDHSSSLGGWKE